MEIYFDDLHDDVKLAVLKFYDIKEPEELNLDVEPLFVLEKEEDPWDEWGENVRVIDPKFGEGAK
jgi:hypothetical protein